MHKHIRQCQIGHSILIHTCVKIRGISGKILAEPMIPIQHARDPVKAESVEMIFLHPPFAVGKEEMHSLVLAIVKAARAPCRMTSLRPSVKIQVLAPVELAESFGLIVNRMRMHYVHHDSDSEPMGLIHEGLELLRCAETRAERKEIGHLITERAVIRMLLKSHYLYRVIAQVSHLGKHVAPELLKSTDTFLLSGHSDMALIYERMFPFPGLAVFPHIRLRVPYLGAESLCMRVLDSPGHIGRQSFRPSAGPLNKKLIQSPVRQEHAAKAYLPVARTDRLQSIGLTAAPVVELPNQIQFGSVGSPFAEHPSAVLCLVKSVIHMVVHAMRQGAAYRNPVPRLLYPGFPCIYGILERHKPRIGVIEHLFSLYFHNFQCFNCNLPHPWPQASPLPLSNRHGTPL